MPCMCTELKTGVLLYFIFEFFPMTTPFNNWPPLKSRQQFLPNLNVSPLRSIGILQYISCYLMWAFLRAFALRLSRKHDIPKNSIIVISTANP